MQYYDLDLEELEILKAFEDDEFKPSKSSATKSQYKKYTQAHLTKSKNVNIRLAEKDLLSLKAMALEEGIPYQTFVTSIIHKFVGGKLITSK